MRSTFLRLQWCCFFLLFFFVVSCSLNLELKKPQGEKEFFQETSRLEKLAREDSATSVRAKSHLKLAFLYVNSRNPQLNYSRALQEMDHWSKYRIEMERKNQSLRAQSDKLQAALEKVQ